MIRHYDPALLAGLKDRAQASPRLRAHHNIHADVAEPVNRLLVAAKAGTYVRPHRHGDKFELFVVLEGGVDLFTFDDLGTVQDRLRLDSNGIRVAELAPGQWHGLAVRGEGCIFLEVKPGPYRPTPETDFAPWAPPEGDHHSALLLQWLESEAAPSRLWPPAAASAP